MNLPASEGGGPPSEPSDEPPCDDERRQGDKQHCCEQCACVAAVVGLAVVGPGVDDLVGLLRRLSGCVGHGQGDVVGAGLDVAVVRDGVGAGVAVSEVP